MPKTAVLIGFGGMGKRYYKALNLMNIKILAICEKNLKNLSTLNLKKTKELLITNNYTKLLNLEADILCVASNTGSRFKIIKILLKKEKLKK